MKYFYFIIVALSTLGCRTPDTSENVKSYKLEISQKNDSQNDLDMYDPKVSFIYLDTSKEFFGAIEKLKLHDNKVYILDKTMVMALYVYDLSGNFLFKYSNYGEGPQEYLQVTDFFVNKDGSIELVDDYLRKIIILDENGMFLEEKKLPFAASNIYKLNDTYFFHTNNLSLKTQTKDNDIGLVVKTSNALEEQMSIVPIDENRGSFIFSMFGNYFFEVDGNAYFIDPFRNVAHSLDEEKNDLIFDFGEANFPKNFFQEYSYSSSDEYKYFNTLNSSKFVWKINCIYDLGDKLYFQYSQNGLSYMGFYLKEKDIFNFTESAAWKSKNPCLVIRTNPHGVYDGKLVYHLSKDNVQTILSKGCIEFDQSQYDESNVLMVVDFK
jgi:hypothetical protein